MDAIRAFVKLELVQNSEAVELLQDIRPDSPSAFPDTQLPSPNDPPWNSWVAIGVWVVSVLLILILPTLFLLPYLATSGIRLTGSEELKEFATGDATAVMLQLAAIIPAHALTLVVCWLVVTKVRRYDFYQTLGFKWGGYQWWHFILILLGIFAAVIVVGSLLPEQDNDVIRMLRSSRWAVYLMTILATFTAPVVEELVYRGVLFSAFQRSRGTVAAVAIVTLLFAGVHYLQYWGSPGTIILITLLSLALTLVRSTSRNLLPCIVLHFLFNASQSVLILFQSADAAGPHTEQASTLVKIFIR